MTVFDNRADPEYIRSLWGACNNRAVSTKNSEERPPKNPGTAGYRREPDRLRLLPRGRRSVLRQASNATKALRMVAASAAYVITAVAVFIRHRVAVDRVPSPRRR